MNVLEETEGKAIIWANYQRDVTSNYKKHYKSNMVRDPWLIIMD